MNKEKQKKEQKPKRLKSDIIYSTETMFEELKARKEQAGNVSELFQKEFEYIESMKPNSKSTKKYLEIYERELQYALQWDIETPDGRRQVEKKEQEAYETFVQNIGDIDYDDWRQLVETFGAIGSATLEHFYRGGANGRGSGEVVEVFSDAKRLKNYKPTDVMKAMLKIEKQSKTDAFKVKYGQDVSSMLRALRNELGLNE